MDTLRNLYRRRLRTGLTVLGIAVGILAFTVMGGMAEKLNMVIKGGEAYFANRIAVRSAGGLMQMNLLLPQDVAVLKAINGVKAVETQIVLPFDETAGFELAPRLLVGVELPGFLQAQQAGGPQGALRLWQGGWWQPGQRKVAVIGASVARKMKLTVGDSIQARGYGFTITGRLAETLSLPDGYILIPQDDAREMMADTSGLLRSLGLQGFVTNVFAVVDPARGDQITGVMAENLRKGFLLSSPQQLTKAAGQASALLNGSIFGAGAIAVLVGALSVINTMFVAVAERTREIGIKKAIGASRWDIIREFLLESTVMGLVGGLVGVAVGAAIVAGFNWYTRDQGTVVFLLTPRLVAGGVLFAMGLGAAAGVLPALRAARLDPVAALREF